MAAPALYKLSLYKLSVDGKLHDTDDRYDVHCPYNGPKDSAATARESAMRWNR